MPSSVRHSMAWLLMMAVAAAAAQAQETPAAKQKTQTKAVGKAAGARVQSPDPVLATVNGHPITRSEILGFLSQYQVAPGHEEEAYEGAVNTLIDTQLLAQYMKTQKLDVPAAEIDAVIAEYEKGAKQNGNSLINVLATRGVSMEELRDRIAQSIKWRMFVTSKATEAELKKYLEQNKDALSGTQVRASHILVMLDENATPEQKAAAKAKIEKVKQEIEEGKISFADAANKYSEDPGNVQKPNGGDLGYFPRQGKFVESFSKAAFGMKPNDIVGPIETEFGYHLIQVTDRKEGQAIDFNQFKDEILAQYSFDLQMRVVEQMRKQAKIDIKPMPADLFPKVPEPATLPAGEQPAVKSATPKGAAPKGAAPKGASAPMPKGR